MLDKINIFKLFKEHLGTLKKFNSDSYNIEDIILFLIFPAILAYALMIYNIALTNNIIIILVTSFSIFAALLFNLLLLIYDIVSKSNGRIFNRNDDGSNESSVNPSNSSSKGKEKKKKALNLKERLLKETYINISYNITISIISIIFLLIIYLMLETMETAKEGASVYPTLLHVFKYVVPLLSFFVYYFLIQFMLTLFMILKRIHVLLSKEFE